MGKTPIFANQYYHFFNRGVNYGKIFFNQGNWYFFLERLSNYFKTEYVDIVAYCLMPNHYHLLVYTKIDDVSNQVMQPFGTSYTKAINKQQGRVGSLFQGPLQAKHISDDQYLLPLSRYIHKNPVHTGFVSTPEEWEFSSYREFVSHRSGTFIKPEIILGQFKSRAEYAKFVCGFNSPFDDLPDNLIFEE
jgi:putative transposase